MTVSRLQPDLELLTQEYVLVQAWKKTASYIRQHNWYADTLELDRAAVNLPSFLGELAEQLSSPETWTNDPLRIVPAPKSQRWHISAKSGKWEPEPDKQTRKKIAKIRPLAHVSLKDQVAATALMLCLADRVETRQGNPALPITDPESRRSTLSYGNRLFCDVEGDAQLHHRWGSTKLYRAYFVDYRTFIARPDIAAESVHDEDHRVIMLHADLKQFFDRVRPSLLREKISGLREPGDDPKFYKLLHCVLGWSWDDRDSDEVQGYAEQAGLAEFSDVSLPQGLVAAGFFANVSLLDFDDCLRDLFSDEIAPGVVMHDACRYVDDLRLVLTITDSITLAETENYVVSWVQDLLERTASGLKLADDKTLVSEFRGDERPLVRQSRRMQRIQTAVSGGFDALGGEEILDAVQGLIRTQQRYSEARLGDQSWEMSPVPDVRDATVARFAAGRYRSTYRSLRPLLEDEPLEALTQTQAGNEVDEGTRSRSLRSKAELDDDARTFALGLIENWINDPSNVRLLRIGLDLWPSKDVLESVFGLLRPFIQKRKRRGSPRRVAWYCLSEIFRAGATETGFIEQSESLPDGVDLAAYRDRLAKEASQIIQTNPTGIPWYLRQQILLYLAAYDPTQAPIQLLGSSLETTLYCDLIRFLRQDYVEVVDVEFATLAILARRSYLDRECATQLVTSDLTITQLEFIAERDPSFALEILEVRPELRDQISSGLSYDLGLNESTRSGNDNSLSSIVLSKRQRSPLRNEIALLRFSKKFLGDISSYVGKEVITPAEVIIEFEDDNSTLPQIRELSIQPSEAAPSTSLYHPPTWSSSTERWRYQLGYLLRFILAAREDFTKQIRATHWKEGAKIYRVPDSHWYQRRFGFHNGQSAFGDNWLPISDWIEKLLSALLAWPGCCPSLMTDFVSRGAACVRELIEARINELSDRQGPFGSVLTLPLSAPWPTPPLPSRPLRVGIVQTVVPTPEDFCSDDLTLCASAVRRRHRRHLSTALAAVERMLDLRETHREHEGRLDWLILPELAVHPRDVQRHLIPFARAHKTIILAGLTYEEIFAGEPLVNSAIWVIPVWSKAHGLQMVTRRQGKQHLAPIEVGFNQTGDVVQGFRPCQWLVGYEWSGADADRPLWLTASICYDATDLHLAAGLRGVSDVFAIPALNKDVNTFDQMAQALHYHMYQMVIVANNGSYGGSNAYVPYQNAFERQVFHLHGQPQASVAFLEIDDIASFLTWHDHEVPEKQALSDGTKLWKAPPAGIQGKLSRNSSNGKEGCVREDGSRANQSEEKTEK